MTRHEKIAIAIAISTICVIAIEIMRFNALGGF